LFNLIVKDGILVTEAHHYETIQQIKFILKGIYDSSNSLRIFDEKTKIKFAIRDYINEKSENKTSERVSTKVLVTQLKSNSEVMLKQLEATLSRLEKTGNVFAPLDPGSVKTSSDMIKIKSNNANLLKNGIDSIKDNCSNYLILDRLTCNLSATFTYNMLLLNSHVWASSSTNELFDSITGIPKSLDELNILNDRRKEANIIAISFMEKLNKVKNGTYAQFDEENKSLMIGFIGTSFYASNMSNNNPNNPYKNEKTSSIQNANNSFNLIDAIKLAQNDPISQVLNYSAGYPEDSSGYFFFYPKDTSKGQCIYKLAVNKNSSDPMSMVYSLAGNNLDKINNDLPLEVYDLMQKTGLNIYLDLSKVNLKGVTFFNINGTRGAGKNRTAYLKYQTKADGIPNAFECDSNDCSIDRLKRGWALVQQKCKGVTKAF
jgi:hypothetical protein